jgi:hypothetical protein
MLAFFTLIYIFGFKEPSVHTLASGSLIWTALVFISIYLIREFIRDIKWTSYYEGYDDCMNELKNGPLKDVYQQWIEQLHKH